ncbi:hypothetical protein HKX48_009224 [Thoreauomyces humboldtii]|nr:hypothetical protein HKX48_009224 [Thoreauomyces humboldtii]
MTAEDAERGDNIADLAKSGKKITGTACPAVRITILAPLLLICALVVTLVPNTLVMNNASQDSTKYISQSYLTTLMEKTKSDAKAPIDQLTPLVNYLGEIPEVVATFTGASPMTGLASLSYVSMFANLKDQYNLDTVTCFTAAWKPPFSASNNPGAGADPTTSGLYNSTTYEYAYFSWINAIPNPLDPSSDVISIIESDIPDQYSTLYGIYPTTREIISTVAPGYSFTIKLASSLINYGGLVQLGLIDPVPGALFGSESIWRNYISDLAHISRSQ